MYLESARALVQGIMILVFVIIANWINLIIGLALISLMGLLLIQQSFTNSCVSDPFLRRLGLKKKVESKYT